MNLLKQLSLKGKLVICFLAVGLIPAVTISFLATADSERTLNAEARNKLESLANLSRLRIQDFFTGLKGQVAGYSLLNSTAMSLSEFSQAYSEVSANNSSAAKMKSYYEKNFLEKFNRMNPGISGKAYEQILADLSPQGATLQELYIEKNTNKAGEKHLYLSSKDERASMYNQVHEKYHEQWRKILDKNGYYDVFLVDANGHVVYSVYKEMDFGVNLKQGVMKSSGLADAYMQAVAKPDEAYISNMASYYPSYNTAAMFVASAVEYGDNQVGAIIVQVPIAKLNEITTNSGNYSQAGLGKTGDIVLVGEQGTYLSSPRWYVEEKSKTPEMLKNLDVSAEKIKLVESRGELVLLTPARSNGAKRALEGKEGTSVYISDWGHEVIGKSMAIDLGNFSWGILAELDTSEALAAMVETRNKMLLLEVISAIIIGILSVMIGRGISNAINKVTVKLTDGAGLVLNSSSQLASGAVQLSQATTEQASSLQETVASLEEIGAMVNRNNEAAQQSKEISEHSAHMAEQGKEVIGEMISSMQEITNGNTQIVHAVNDSNMAMKEIIVVINEIAEKTKVINDIVFQTKLLSFNASVEAARAGEHGKGFAVVAEEVGNLAGMSGRAADEISAMLAASVDRVKKIAEETQTRVSELIKNASSRVEQGGIVADRCGRILEEIVVDVGRVNSMIAQIAAASSEQTSGIREINLAMNQLDDATQQNTMVANQSSQAAEELKGQADNLAEISVELETLVYGLNERIKKSQMQKH